MTIKYLDAARQGKNQWWRYILILTVVPAIPACCISIILIICLQLFGNINYSDLQNKVLVAKSIRMMPPWALYLLVTSFYASMCACILLGLQKIHKRDFSSVICPNQRFNIGRYVNSSIAWLLISLLFRIFELKLNPQAFQDFRLVFNPIDWLIYLIPAVITAFTFASFTEIIRGYVLQGLGLLLRHKYLAILMSSLLSSVILMCINKSQCPPYQCMVFNFILGIGLAISIVRENSLELVLGIQTAVNLVPRFLTYQSSENPPSSLPNMFSVNLNSQLASSTESIEIVILLIKLAIFYALFLRKPQTTNHW
jgi:uncharacterized protein